MKNYIILSVLFAIALGTDVLLLTIVAGNLVLFVWLLYLNSSASVLIFLHKKDKLVMENFIKISALLSVVALVAYWISGTATPVSIISGCEISLFFSVVEFVVLGFGLHRGVRKQEEVITINE